MSYYTDCLAEFHALLEILWNDRTYKYVYLSIGSKINEYEFRIKESSKMITIKTNAHLQMCPSFVCDRNSNVLLICLDNFRNETDEKINREVCKGIIQSNMDFIFYNHYITLESIAIFMKSLIPILESRKILPENLMICNYIRFFNEPNIYESVLEEHLSDTIYNTISSSEYKKSLFQWFGYHPNLYNIIFNYHDYYVIYISKFRQISQFFRKKYESAQISIYVAPDLKDEILTTPILAKFMKSTVDINSYYHGEKLADPLIEWA